MRFYPIFSFLILLFLFACHRNNNCLRDEVAPVISVNVPDSGFINQDISIPITYGIGSGCGRFQSVDVTAQGNVRNIRVMARYEGCICTMQYATLETSYLFRTATPGTFYFNFQQSGTDILHDSIVVR